MSSDVSKVNKWWGNIEIFPQKRVHLQCADLILVLECFPSDWHIQYEFSRENLQNKHTSPSLNYADMDDSQTELETQQRFASSKLPQHVIFRPSMVDRSVVCRSNVSIVLLPKEEISLYVGLPLCLQLLIENQDDVLLDIPVSRISDTWFGPNSREGVFAYSCHNSEQLEVMPTNKYGIKATMEVKIKNISETVFTLDKICVPATDLDLFVDEQGDFWTRSITMVREEGDTASVTINKEMSCNLNSESVTLVSKARGVDTQNKITQAFWALFG